MYNWKKMVEYASRQPDSAEIMEDWNLIFDEHLTKLAECHPEMYEEVMEAIYISVYGEHFNEVLALKAVACMKNTDGSKGEHWSFEETSSVAKQNSISFDTFNEWDWYYALNMTYSDYYKIFGADSGTYIKVAKAWLDDPDVSPGKAYRYYAKVAK